MAKEKGKIYELRINVRNPKIFSSFTFPNYVDEHNVARDLKDARGNVISAGLSIGFLVTRFDSSKARDLQVIEWLMSHPLVGTPKVTLVNMSEQEDKSIDREIEAAHLTRKVLELSSEGTRQICAVMNYNYKAEPRIRNAMLIKAAKNYSDSNSSPFQNLRKALENKNSKLHLEIKEFMEYGIIKNEMGAFMFVQADGTSSHIGITDESCITFLLEHPNVHATMKSMLRNKKGLK